MVSSKSPLQHIAEYRARIRRMTPPRTAQEKRLIRMLEFLIRESLMRWAEGDRPAQVSRCRGQSRDPTRTPTAGAERPALGSVRVDRDSEDPGLPPDRHAKR